MHGEAVSQRPDMLVPHLVNGVNIVVMWLWHDVCHGLLVHNVVGHLHNPPYVMSSSRHELVLSRGKVLGSIPYFTTPDPFREYPIHSRNLILAEHGTYSSLHVPVRHFRVCT